MRPQAILGRLLTAVVGGPQTILGPSSNLHTIVSFGDSYTDTGFMSTGGTLPSPVCPLGNPSCYTGIAYTTGYNWLSSLTSLHNRSLTLTYNLAHGGDVLSTVLIPGRQSVLGNQVPQLVNLAPNITTSNPEEVLWSVFIGINDIGVTVMEGGNPLNPAFLDALQQRYFETLLAGLWHDYGARRFLLWTVPDTARTPMFRGSKYEPFVRGAVKGLNRRIKDGAAKFITGHPDTEVVVFDAFTEFNAVLDAPVKYGFRDAVTACQQQDCFWWDQYHPGEKAQVFFGKRVAGLLAEVGWW
jgi:phospholipase/lecithinase/hemolysin